MLLCWFVSKQILFALCFCKRWDAAKTYAATLFGQYEFACNLFLSRNGRFAYTQHIEGDECPSMQIATQFALLIVFVGMRCNDFDCLAYNAIRPLISKFPLNYYFCALLSEIATQLKYDKKIIRFIGRITKGKISPFLSIITGHSYLLTRRYQIAAMNYLNAYEMFPESPSINLYLGVAYLQHAIVRTGADRFNRHLFFLQALSFLHRYYKFSRQSATASYNMGRAYQTIGVNEIAIIFYHRALHAYDLAPVSEKPRIHREAAYNLAGIYCEAGQNGLANNLLFKYGL